MEERRRKSFFLYGWIDGWVSIDSREERKKGKKKDVLEISQTFFFFKKKIQKIDKIYNKIKQEEEIQSLGESQRRGKKIPSFKRVFVLTNLMMWRRRKKKKKLVPFHLTLSVSPLAWFPRRLPIGEITGLSLTTHGHGDVIKVV